MWTPTTTTPEETIKNMLNKAHTTHIIKKTRAVDYKDAQMHTMMRVRALECVCMRKWWVPPDNINMHSKINVCLLIFGAFAHHSLVVENKAHSIRSHCISCAAVCVRVRAHLRALLSIFAIFEFIFVRCCWCWCWWCWWGWWCVCCLLQHIGLRFLSHSISPQIDEYW